MKVKCAEPIITVNMISEAEKVLRSGRFVSGEHVAAFEREFAEYHKVPHAVAVNSGTAALHLALLDLDLPKGSKVAVPAMSFFATVSAVVMAGYEPYFIDVDKKNYGMSAGALYTSIENEIRAVVPVHLYGIPCDIVRIQALCDCYNIPVIEDCAQAHGSSVKSRKVGTFGEAACFSFYATKHMTTLEGGMILTHSGHRADHYRSLRSHGMRGRDIHTEIGYNYRMNELSGILGFEQLKHLDSWNLARRAATRAILNAVEDNVSWLEPYDYEQEGEGRKYSTYFWAPCMIKDTNRMSLTLLAYELKRRGIEIRWRYTKPLNMQPAIIKEYPHVQHMQLSTASYLSKRTFGLPNRPYMPDAEIDYVVKALQEIGADHGL